MRQACTLWDNLTVTHCHSWGYDLITLAEVLWHPTAALRHRTEAMRCHTAAQGQPQQDTLRCCRGAETDCHTVLSHKLCDGCRAVRASDWELEIQKKGIMCKPTTQNNIGYVCAYYNWLWLYLIMLKNYFVMNENQCLCSSPKECTTY